MEAQERVETSRRDRVVLGLLVGGALLARLLWVWHSAGEGIVFDKYFFLARRLAAAGWVADIPFTSSPLYTYLVGLLHVLLGQGETGVRLAQAAAGAATVIPVWHAARRFAGEGPAKVVAGAIAAFYPAFVLYDTEPLSFVWENLANALTLLLLARHRERRARRPLILAGCALGLSALLRPNVLPVFALLLVWLWLDRETGAGAGAWAARSGALLAAVCATVAPVAVMNSIADGGLVLVTASGGSTLYGGNNPDTNGLIFQPTAGAIALQLTIPPESIRRTITAEHLAFRRQASWIAGRELSAREASAFWRGEVLAYARRDPRGFARLALAKLRLFFHAYESHDINTASVRGEALFWPMRVAFVLVWCAGLAGLALAAGAWRGWLPVYGYLLTSLSTAVLFYVNCRLRLPAVLPLALGAGLLASTAAARWRERSRPAVSLAAALLLALAAALVWPNAAVRSARANERAFFGHFQPACELLSRGEVDAGARELAETVRIYPGLAGSVLAALERCPPTPAVSAARASAAAAAQARTVADPGAADGYHRLMEQAMGLVILGSHREALVKLEQAARLRPAAHLPYSLMAAAAAALGDRAAALARLEEAFSRGGKFQPGLDGTLLELGAAAADAGDRIKAAGYCRQALFVNPGRADAAELLQRIAG